MFIGKNDFNNTDKRPQAGSKICKKNIFGLVSFAPRIFKHGLDKKIPRNARSDCWYSRSNVSVFGPNVNIIIVVVGPQHVGVLFTDAGMQKLFDVCHELRRMRIRNSEIDFFLSFAHNHKPNTHKTVCWLHPYSIQEYNFVHKLQESKCFN